MGELRRGPASLLDVPPLLSPPQLCAEVSREQTDEFITFAFSHTRAKDHCPSPPLTPFHRLHRSTPETTTYSEVPPKVRLDHQYLPPPAAAPPPSFPSYICKTQRGKAKEGEKVWVCVLCFYNSGLNVHVSSARVTRVTYVSLLTCAAKFWTCCLDTGDCPDS